MGFPSQVNVVQAPAVAGDFASANPRFSVDAGPGGFIAGPVNGAGVAVGLFAWADAANVGLYNTGSGVPTGFISRHQQAIITAFLADSTMLIPAGMPVIAYNGGDFWVKNAGTVATAIGQKAYANNATGAISFAATGTPPTGGTSTSSSVALNVGSAATTIAANSATGYISSGTGNTTVAGNVMTVTAMVSGAALSAGQTLTGTGIGPVTSIVSQLTGTTGGVGTYQVSVSQLVASTTIAASGGSMVVAAMTSGTFAAGQSLTGTNVTAGTTILAQVSGTAGGAGTYAVSLSQTAAAAAVTASGGTLTVGGTVTGTFALNDVLSGSGVTAGYVLGNAISNAAAGLTGTGGAGTYLTSVGQTLAAQAVNALGSIETKWYCMSVGNPGELVKMSDHAIG